MMSLWFLGRSFLKKNSFATRILSPSSNLVSGVTVENSFLIACSWTPFVNVRSPCETGREKGLE